MGYKDKKVQKKYQQEWYIRKKAGLPTRTTTPLSEEERTKRKKQQKRRASERKRNKRKKIKERCLGNKCFFCKNKKHRRLISHRKDGERHKAFECMTNQQFKCEMESGEYVLLCYICHKAIHWCMDFLYLTWEEIIVRFKK